MELTQKQQAVELIKKSKNILIATSENAKGDGIASALALTHILEKLDKQVVFLISSGRHKNFHFLPGIEKVKQEFSGLRDFIISLSLEKGEIDRVKYNTEGDRLHFLISPKGRNFEKEDVSFSYGGFNFDLIIVIDSPDLESLGSVYDSNAEFFQTQPIINIDHHSGNDYFGQVNFVDLAASSASEMLVSLIESIDSKLVDENIATCLLTGIISSTNSFQNLNTTPKSLTITAQLIAAGANHEQVVKNLFKTKSFDVLKIWGDILSNVQTDEQHKLLWSEMSQGKINSFNNEKEVIQGVLDELLSTAPNIKVYLLFLRKENLLKVYIKTSKEIEAKKISHIFGGSGHGQDGEFELENVSLDVAKENILSRIKEELKESGLIN